MLALLRRASFLTTFCGLYFSHHYTSEYQTMLASYSNGDLNNVQFVHCFLAW